MQATVSRLVIYPVKSLQGIDVTEAVCLETGLQYDREWVIVAKNNLFVSQRNLPAMATIKVAITESELVLSHPKHGACAVPLSGNATEAEELTIWKDQSLGKDEGDAVSTWLTQVLGLFRGDPLRLLRFDPARTRIVREKYTSTTDSQLMFADACPYLIVNTSSLSALNDELLSHQHQTINIERFRGNIVISGIPAWQEYQAHTLQFDNVTLRGEAPCHRCPMPGINQETGDIPEPGQPFKTLMKMPIPADLSGAYFGQHATFKKGTGNRIKVGEIVEFAD